MDIKQFLKIELSNITSDNVDGYCNIYNEEYKIYNEDDKVILEIYDTCYSRNGNTKFQTICNELIINGKYITNIKDFCIDLMKHNGYNYSEEDGFIKGEC